MQFITERSNINVFFCEYQSTRKDQLKNIIDAKKQTTIMLNFLIQQYKKSVNAYL